MVNLNSVLLMVLLCEAQIIGASPRQVPVGAAQVALPVTSELAAGTPPAAPEKMTLPAGCKVVPGSATASDGRYEWQIDCGQPANSAARATIGENLPLQGWVLCSSRGAVGTWWFAGVRMSVVEGEGGGAPFRIVQEPALAGCP